MNLLLTIASAVLLLSASATNAADKWDISKIDTSKLPAAADKKGLTYETDIKPLFKASCVRCHGEQRPKANLRLDSLEAILKGGEDGKVVIPGESKKSLLLAAAAQLNDQIAMPPKRGPGRGGPGGFKGDPKDTPGPTPPNGSAGNQPAPGGQDDHKHPEGSSGSGQDHPGSFGGRGGFGPPPRPLTTEQVALVRAWIDQGAK